MSSRYGDLPTGAMIYRAQRFNVFAGGTHRHASTRNALTVTNDGSFMELIEWTAYSPEERWQQILKMDGEGLVDFALTTKDLPGVLARARSHDVEMAGPIDGSREALDGVSSSLFVRG
jgi:Glyoxalase-like domain